MSDKEKLKQLKKMLEGLEQNMSNVRSMITAIEEGQEVEFDPDNIVDYEEKTYNDNDFGRIIEGVFDGTHMIGDDGKRYLVSANYASKSKLVEGDILKLTIAPDGKFIYKQIKPAERERLIGRLVKDKQTNEFRVLVSQKLYKVLLASVTYFKGAVGDEAVIVVPAGGISNWAAVENIIKVPENSREKELAVDLDMADII